MSDIPPWHSIVERLRAVVKDAEAFDGSILKEWDKVRANLLTNKSDHPRMMFECNILAPLLEHISGAADEIERLEAVDAKRFALFQARNDEIERLTEQLHYANGTCDLAMKHRDAAEAEIERLTEECEAWRECAKYDPKMEGPAFKGWDRSALDRCRTRYT